LNAFWTSFIEQPRTTAFHVGMIVGHSFWLARPTTTVFYFAAAAYWLDGGAAGDRRGNTCEGPLKHLSCGHRFESTRNSWFLSTVATRP